MSKIPSNNRVGLALFIAFVYCALAGVRTVTDLAPTNSQPVVESRTQVGIEPLASPAHVAADDRTIVAGAPAVRAFTASAFSDGAASRRLVNNRLQVAKMNGFMRPKINAMISDLEKHGYQPTVDPGVYRTPAEQMQKFRQGYSKVTYSFHNANTCDGKSGSCTPRPDSLAADITDARWGWSDKCPREFWLKLASASENHGLTTGIYWGLSQAQRKAVHTAIAKKNWTAKVALGWDEAHNEPRTITIAQAHRGVRPK